MLSIPPPQRWLNGPTKRLIKKRTLHCQNPVLTGPPSPHSLPFSAPSPAQSKPCPGFPTLSISPSKFYPSPAGIPYTIPTLSMQLQPSPDHSIPGLLVFPIPCPTIPTLSMQLQPSPAIVFPTTPNTSNRVHTPPAQSLQF